MTKAADLANKLANLFTKSLGLSAAEQGQARANFGAGLMTSFRNKLINGDFAVWQRGTVFTATGYMADRWLCGADGSGSGRAFTVSQQVDQAANELMSGTSAFHLRWTETTAGSGYGFKTIEQRIESVRTSASKQVTLTFWACMPQGGGAPIPVFLRQHFGSGGSAGVDTLIGGSGFVIPNDGVWRKYTATATIPSIVGKTVGTNHYLSVLFFMPTSVPFNIGMKNVSLVEGDATAEADPLSPRHIQQELAFCKRYYRLMPSAQGASITGQNATFQFAVGAFIDGMRIPVPTAILLNGIGAVLEGAVAFRNVSAIAAMGENVMDLTMTTGMSGDNRSGQVLGGRIGLDAEL